jgi:hypothetical protein
VTALGRAVAHGEQVATEANGGVYVDPLDWFCYQGRCPAVVGTTPVMRDGTHITSVYARQLAPLLHRYLLPTKTHERTHRTQ